MSSLSPISLQFLRTIKNNPRHSRSSEAYGQACTQLFCELYDIMREVKDALDDHKYGFWTLTYQGSELDKKLSFSFNLHKGLGQQTINLDFTIDLFNTSYLCITSPSLSEDVSKDDMKDFVQSPAYRRYFAPYGSSDHQLRTEISDRQFRSRHLGDYLIHLCEMTLPYIKILHERAEINDLIAV